MFFYWAWASFRYWSSQSVIKISSIKWACYIYIALLVGWGRVQCLTLSINNNNNQASNYYVIESTIPILIALILVNEFAYNAWCNNFYVMLKKLDNFFSIKISSELLSLHTELMVSKWARLNEFLLGKILMEKLIHLLTIHPQVNMKTVAFHSNDRRNMSLYEYTHIVP